MNLFGLPFILFILKWSAGKGFQSGQGTLKLNMPEDIWNELYCIYPKIFFYELFLIFTCSSHLHLYMCLSLSVFCAPIRGCTVIC